VPQRTLAALEALVAQGEALPRAAASLEDATRKLERLESTWRDAHQAATEATARTISEASSSVGASISTAVELVGPAAKQVVAPLLTEMIAHASGALSTHVRELRASHDAMIAASRARDEAHTSSVADSIARLASAEQERAAALAVQWADLTRSMGESARVVQAAASAAVTQGQEQLGALVLRQETLGTRLDALLTGVVEVTSASTTAAEAQATRMAAHAEVLGTELTRTARVVAESAELLRAGGGELGAVAEAFGVAVDRHRDASMAWMESLGTIDDAVAQAGERAGAGALSAAVARMDEVFERQIQIELELFTQLRALRGLPPAQAPQDHGKKSDAPA
jgi:hypothetical protein